MGRGRVLGREKETARLQESWERTVRGEAQLVVVRGGRRVGKTHVVSHFASGRRSIYFAGTQDAESIELGRLERAAERQLPELRHLTTHSFATWRSALELLAASSTGSPLLVVLDNVCSVVRSTPDFVDTLRAVWQALPCGARLMLVLVGSSRPEPRLCDPLPGPVGRDPVVLSMEPLGAAQARAFLPELRPPAFVEAFAACGGYPLHLLAWEQEATVDENLLLLAGTTGGILADDAERILRDVLPDTGGHMRILAAIGRHRTRYSEILVAADQRIDHALEVLIRSGLVQRTVPVGAPAAANATDYDFTDTYLAFWFRVLYPRLPDVDVGQGAAALRSGRSAWAEHVAWTFKDAARAHARRLGGRGELPGDLTIGRWWSSTARASAVEVLGARDGRTVLLGDAQWGERSLGVGDLVALHSRLSLVPRPVPDPVYALWGREGISAELRMHVLGFDAEAVVAE